VNNNPKDFKSSSYPDTAPGTGLSYWHHDVVCLAGWLDIKVSELTEVKRITRANIWLGVKVKQFFNTV